MGVTQYYTATSLDGFIADADNSLDWLFTRAVEPDGPLSYGEFIRAVGATAMGSTTYEWVLANEGADSAAPEEAADPATSDDDPGDAPSEWTWPPKVPTWVFTHRDLPVVPDAPIQFTSADVRAVHQEMLAAAGDRNVWIMGGGDLAGQFADAGLLDEVIVSIAPVTLGGGAPLLPRRAELRLEEVGRNGDFVAARFAVVTPQAGR